MSGSKYALNDPVAAALGDGRLFVANEALSSRATNPGSVTVIDASTGRHLKSLTGPSYAFGNPAGVAFDGTHLWVTNSTRDTVTEISASTDAELHVVTNSWNPYPGFHTPTAVIASGTDVFVASSGATPMLTQIFTKQPVVGFWMCNSNGPFNFDVPSALAVSGANLWVANSGNDTLTEMNLNKGTFIRQVVR